MTKKAGDVDAQMPCQPLKNDQQHQEVQTGYDIVRRAGALDRRLHEGEAPYKRQEDPPEHGHVGQGPAEQSLYLAHPQRRQRDEHDRRDGKKLRAHDQPTDRRIADGSEEGDDAQHRKRYK